MPIAMLFPKMDGPVSRCRMSSVELWLWARLVLVLQEAIANGNPSLVKLVMKYRNYQRNVQRIRGIPDLLRKLKEVRYSFSLFESPIDMFSSIFSRQVS